VQCSLRYSLIILFPLFPVSHFHFIYQLYSFIYQFIYAFIHYPFTLFIYHSFMCLFIYSFDLIMVILLYPLYRKFHNSCSQQPLARRHFRTFPIESGNRIAAAALAGPNARAMPQPPRLAEPQLIDLLNRIAAAALGRLILAASGAPAMQTLGFHNRLGAAALLPTTCLWPMQQESPQRTLPGRPLHASPLPHTRDAACASPQSR